MTLARDLGSLIAKWGDVCSGRSRSIWKLISNVHDLVLACATCACHLDPFGSIWVFCSHCFEECSCHGFPMFSMVLLSSCQLKYSNYILRQIRLLFYFFNLKRFRTSNAMWWKGVKKMHISNDLKWSDHHLRRNERIGKCPGRLWLLDLATGWYDLVKYL